MKIALAFLAVLVSYASAVPCGGYFNIDTCVCDDAESTKVNNPRMCRDIEAKVVTCSCADGSEWAPPCGGAKTLLDVLQMKKPVHLNVHAMMVLSLSHQVEEDVVDAAEDEDVVVEEAVVDEVAMEEEMATATKMRMVIRRPRTFEWRWRSTILKPPDWMSPPAVSDSSSLTDSSRLEVSAVITGLRALLQASQILKLPLRRRTKMMDSKDIARKVSGIRTVSLE